MDQVGGQILSSTALPGDEYRKIPAREGAQVAAKPQHRLAPSHEGFLIDTGLANASGEGQPELVGVGFPREDIDRAKAHGADDGSEIGLSREGEHWRGARNAAEAVEEGKGIAAFVPEIEDECLYPPGPRRTESGAAFGAVDDLIVAPEEGGEIPGAVRVALDIDDGAHKE